MNRMQCQFAADSSRIRDRLAGQGGLIEGRDTSGDGAIHRSDIAVPYQGASRKRP
jgi:hypothetical protein